MFSADCLYVTCTLRVRYVTCTLRGRVRYVYVTLRYVCVTLRYVCVTICVRYVTGVPESSQLSAETGLQTLSVRVPPLRQQRLLSDRRLISARDQPAAQLITVHQLIAATQLGDRAGITSVLCIAAAFCELLNYVLV